MTRDDHTTTEAAAADYERDHTPEPDGPDYDVTDLTEQQALRRMRANRQTVQARRWWAQ